MYLEVFVLEIADLTEGGTNDPLCDGQITCWRVLDFGRLASFAMGRDPSSNKEFHLWRHTYLYGFLNTLRGFSDNMAGAPVRSLALLSWMVDTIDTSCSCLAIGH